MARKHGILLSRKRFRARFGVGEIGNDPVILIKPQTYVNLSGLSVKGFLFSSNGSLKDLIVIHDDLDLDLGRIRIRERGGHGGHKGLQSVIQAMGGTDFVRLKVGIGRPRVTTDVKDYVLRPFDREERAHLNGILLRAVAAVETILLEGVEKAMNTFHGGVAFERGDE